MKTAPVLLRLTNLHPPEVQPTPTEEDITQSESISASSEAVSIEAEPQEANIEDEPVETAAEEKTTPRTRRQLREAAEADGSWKPFTRQLFVGGGLIVLFLIAYMAIIFSSGNNEEDSSDDLNPAGLVIDTGEAYGGPVETLVSGEETLTDPNEPPPLPQDHEPPQDDNPAKQVAKDPIAPDFKWEASPYAVPKQDRAARDNHRQHPNNNDHASTNPKPAPKNSYTYPVTDPAKHRYLNRSTSSEAPPLRTGRRPASSTNGANRSQQNNRAGRAALRGTIELPQTGRLR